MFLPVAVFLFVVGWSLIWIGSKDSSEGLRSQVDIFGDLSELKSCKLACARRDEEEGLHS